VSDSRGTIDLRYDAYRRPRLPVGPACRRHAGPVVDAAQAGGAHRRVPAGEGGASGRAFREDQGAGAGRRDAQGHDAFNMEHSAQIAALNQDAESIRGELAKFSAANPQPADGQSAETLVRHSTTA